MFPAGWSLQRLSWAPRTPRHDCLGSSLSDFGLDGRPDLLPQQEHLDALGLHPVEKIGCPDRPGSDDP